MYGISRDSIASHQKFANKYGLNMPLLADTESVVCEAYDVLKQKNNFGKVSVGIERTTYIIDPEGKIARVFPKVKVEGHAEAVLEAIHALSGS